LGSGFKYQEGDNGALTTRLSSKEKGTLGTEKGESKRSVAEKGLGKF